MSQMDRALISIVLFVLLWWLMNVRRQRKMLEKMLDRTLTDLERAKDPEIRHMLNEVKVIIKNLLWVL